MNRLAEKKNREEEEEDEDGPKWERRADVSPTGKVRLRIYHCCPVLKNCLTVSC